MSKRKRFLITSFVLSLGFIGVTLLENEYRFLAIGGLGIATLAFFVWSLWEGLDFNMTILALVLPVYFTLGVGIFWFLLPVNLFARIPIIIFYGIGIYVLCLTMNIFTVAAMRTIALLRAARGVGFVLTLVTSFLVFNAILSLKTMLATSSIAVALLAFPLFLQGLWGVSLEKRFSKNLIGISLISSLVVGEIGLALHFWPVTVVVGSLFLTVTVYMLLGLLQSQLEGKLFKQTVREYLVLGTLVFIGMYFATHWGS